jgi:hypothetical protein
VAIQKHGQRTDEGESIGERMALRVHQHAIPCVEAADAAG